MYFNYFIPHRYIILINIIVIITLKKEKIRENEVIYFYILHLGKPRDSSLKLCEPIKKFPILMNSRIYKIQSYFSIK